MFYFISVQIFNLLQSRLQFQFFISVSVVITISDKVLRKYFNGKSSNGEDTKEEAIVYP